MIPAAALTLPIRLITPATLGFLQCLADGPSTIMEIAECLELPTERVRLASRLLERRRMVRRRPMFRCDSRRTVVKPLLVWELCG